MPGTLFVVATPIGNLEDITARALRVLREVAIIAAEDTRRTARLLAHYAIATPTTSLHEHNEASKIAILLARLERGDTVALVSDAGTPGISDPGQRLVRAAMNAGASVQAVPGPSAVTTALAASGFPADTFTFLGFPPTKPSARQEWLSALRTAGRTVVFFEAPHRIRQTLEQILALVGDCDVTVAREMTKAHEELVIGPISRVLGDLKMAKGEFTVVIDMGHVTNSVTTGAAEDSALLHEFGELTALAGVSRRRAIKTLALRHARQPNEIYEVIERGKKSVT